MNWNFDFFYSNSKPVISERLAVSIDNKYQEWMFQWRDGISISEIGCELMNLWQNEEEMKEQDLRNRTCSRCGYVEERRYAIDQRLGLCEDCIEERAGKCGGEWCYYCEMDGRCPEQGVLDMM